MAVPYTFASATSAIPLSQLDSNFATAVTIGNVAVQLGNTATTLGNVTLANVTITSVSSPITVTQGGTGNSSAFTANAVVYAPTTSTLASGSGLVFDGSNLGLGVTPSAWGSSAKVLEIGTIGNGFYGSTSSDSHTGMVSGAYQNSGWKYSRTGINPIRFSMNDAVLGQMEWYNAPSGTAGNAITWTQLMTLNANGALVLQGGSTSATGVGIAFPATQSASSDANTLDDYEEGTWTPTVTANSGTATTYTIGTATYTKTGRMVVVIGSIIPTNGTFGSTNNYARMTGLPFTVATRTGTGSGGNNSNLNNGVSTTFAYSTTVDVAFTSGVTSANEFSFTATYFV